MTIDQQLADARAALKANKIDAALKSISEAWRRSPSPELLELACAVSPPVPLKAAKGKETAEAMKAARKAGPDPRVSRALEQLLTDVPWTADSSKPVWREAFELAAALKDPRWVSLAEALPKQWKFRAPMAAWMGSQLKKAVAPLAKKPAPALSAEHLKAVKALHALVPKKPAAPDGKDAASLLAAVFATPDDDAPRRVFADFLQEQGDPRGEFITLQLAAKPETSKREKELLKAHGKHWLDGIAIARDVEFRRGFLSKVKVTFRNQGDAEKYGALPAWATVEQLELSSANNANDQHVAGQTIPEPAVSLQRIEGLNGFGIENLCARKTPLPALTAIEGYLREVQQWRALLDSKLFPNLREVALSGVDPAWLQKNPAPDHWSLEVAWTDLGPLYRAMAATKTKRFSWRYRDWARFEFSRGPGGDLSQLVLRMTSASTPSVVRHHLEQLPEGCLTSFELIGKEDEAVAAARKRLVRRAGAMAAKVAPLARQLLSPLAITEAPNGHVFWADQKGLLELDASGALVKDLSPGSWSSGVFSSDASTFFGGDHDRVEVFSTSTGERLEVLKTPCSTSYRHLSLSRDGKVLAAPMNPGVSVCWPGKAAKPAVYKGASCFALTPDGKQLLRADLTWGKGALELHPLGEKARGKKFAKDSPEFTAVTCAPDGETAATFDQTGSLKLWELATQTLLAAHAGAKAVVRLAFSPDGKSLAAAGAKKAWVFDVATGKARALDGGADAIAWGKDGTLLRGVSGRLLR